MNRLRRRLSPSTLIATAALIVATSGTAIAAGEIITSPDRLAAGVVTEPKLANDAVTSPKLRDRSILQQDEAHPTLRQRVARTGTAIRGDATEIKHVKGSNRYDLRFGAPKLGVQGMDNCAFTVSPTFSAIGTLEAHPMRAYVNYAQGSDDVQVFTFEERFNPTAQKVQEVATEAAFDLVLAC